MLKFVVTFPLMLFSIWCYGLAQENQKKESSPKEEAPSTAIMAVLNHIAQNFKFNLDFRFRFEEDWDSKTDNGSLRPDRFRMRIRFRTQVRYTLGKHILLGARLRTGNPRSQQSPHITLGGQTNEGADGTDATQRVAGENEPFSVLLDRVYAKFFFDIGNINLWAWVGKNSFPFWHQNELFWDDDVSPEGITLGQKFNTKGPFKFNLTEGYYIVYGTGNTFLQSDSRMIGGQGHASYGNSAIGLNAAASFFYLENMPLRQDADLADFPNLEKINYSFLKASVNFTYKLKINGYHFPIQVGGDYFINFEDYATTKYSGITNAEFQHLKNQKTGYVLSLSLGRLKKQFDFRFRYYYAHIERFSVVNYFAQDDWVRWGNVNFNRTSNFKGHEISVAFCILDKFNIVTRLFLVSAIEKRKPENASLETGNRIRMDFNLKL